MLPRLVVTAAALVVISWAQGCAKRELSTGIICVCNATYCDTIEPLGTIPQGKAVLYLTDIGGARMERTEVEKTSSPGSLTLTIDASTQFQELLGIGGSFTDAVGINLASLSEAARQRLIESYFGPSGASYTLGRVPIASTDFSTRPYSYAEEKDDFEMEHFVLALEDFEYKLPLIKQAAALQEGFGGLRLIGCPWSAPAWMKSNNIMNGGGKLRGWEGGPYYDAWAKYFVKFYESYAAEGVSFWGTEIQNEPRSGNDPNYKWQSMLLTPEMEANFLVDQLAPALAASPATAALKVFSMTDQRGALPDWTDTLFNNSAARALSSGVTLHWYEDDFKPASMLTDLHNAYPEQILIASEASNAFMDPHSLRIRPGDYSRAEKYAHSVIEDLNNFVSGWIDWNLALNMQGGPNWVDNILDANILIDASKDEFYKQPAYYALAHFSKFIRPGAHRVLARASSDVKHLETLAVVNADGSRVVVAMNTDKNEVVALSLVDGDDVIDVQLGPHSIVTAIWN